MNKGKFPEILKIAEVAPIFKKANSFEKGNYRPISILSNISKMYEGINHNQMNDFFTNKLSKYQCGFRKGFGAQHCFLMMIEKLEESEIIKRLLQQCLLNYQKLLTVFHMSC